MPKGEHFKKPNPRINQVSFKVNDKELARLNELASAQNLSIPEWIRAKINHTESGKIETVENKNQPIKKENKIDVSENQISLF